PVAIGRDRLAAARLLAETSNIDVILSDDGLQHYRLARALEVAVVDGSVGYGNGWLLPAGPLREPVGRLADVAAVVVNGELRRALALPAPVTLAMRLRVSEVRSVDGSSRVRSLESFVGTRVHAVAAIGQPQRFFSMLRAAGIELIEHPANDHHRWQANELDFRDGLPLLMTAKDAVKCRRFARSDWWRVDVEAELPAADAARLLQMIEKAGNA
ncbi:MAG: tetraacyldisaccharide 4'-kinase, partial [Steroidobacteraceae bacterium]|nr:tetraacyldisaccharide 4'-kinase [Steroidobacteraceae bacterium]MDW8258995.1 tetraacyldisaccharide 4'-kinase [Gammaproteobacteria bacterium]